MLSHPIEVLLERLKTQKSLTHAAPDDTPINVNRLTEKAGAAYEKLRYLVDYKDERHIRRSAIERIIKRKIIFEGGEDIGLSLIQELIAGRFFPNNEDDFVVDAFYQSIADSIRVDAPLEESFIKTQILIACYRSLLNTDDETLRYKLWLKQMPDEWHTLEDESTLANIASHGKEIWNGIRTALTDPLSFRLLPKLTNYAIYFSIIREVIRAYGAESERILSDHEGLRRFTRDFLEKNYKRQFTKARGSAVRAVFYIFLTKMLLAIALEVPYQIYFLSGIEYIPIATNIVFHPLLLILITVSVRKLDDENTKAIETGVHNVLSGGNIRLIN